MENTGIQITLKMIKSLSFNKLITDQMLNFTLKHPEFYYGNTRVYYL